MGKLKPNPARLDRWWLIACLVIAAAVMMSFIAKSSIWHDEGYSLLLATQPAPEIIERTARDVHPPLYYLVLHGWTGIFGTSELAARSLSVMAVLGTMAVMFLIIKRLFGSSAARLSVLLMSLAPFLVRYGQEARMYSLGAFLLTLATYLLITAMDSADRRRYWLYALVMAAAFYTHYYTIFMVIVHWLYVASRTQWRGRAPGRLDLKGWPWWAANALIVLLFIPWLPAAYAQFSRVQGGFWIADVNLYTLPSTIAQFLRFAPLPSWARLSLPLLILAIVVWSLWLSKLERASLWLLTCWVVLAPAAVFVISLLSRPVYVDRYFVFAAVAFYPLLAVLLFVRPLNRLAGLRPLVIGLLLGAMVVGINNVYKQSNHRMREVGEIVSQRLGRYDRVIAGELYVYLDFAYYNHSGQPLYLYSPNGISGYGETSLLYDQPELIIENYKQLGAVADSVWVVGKTGDKDYFKAIPEGWTLLEEFQAGESIARRYQTLQLVRL